MKIVSSNDPSEPPPSPASIASLAAQRLIHAAVRRLFMSGVTLERMKMIRPPGSLAVDVHVDDEIACRVEAKVSNPREIGVACTWLGKWTMLEQR